METSALAEIVDLDRYPIDRITVEAGRILVTSCRSQLAESGACSLPGFVNPAAVERTVEIGNRLVDRAWHADESHNVYFTDLADPAHIDLAERHPRRHAVRSSQWAVAYDRLPADLPIRRLYESDAMLGFLEAVLDTEPLYRSIDPLDALEISYFHPGDELGWHFDNSEFSVTLMLQEPERGGDFEYHPAIRSADDENYPAVEEALGAGSPGRVLPTSPGTLAIFQGRHSLHRVTPVEGETTRMNAVLTYGAEPDMCLSGLTQELFYGRRMRSDHVESVATN